ncbi:PIN-like domain-containing protein, partial [Exiguobacterium sp. B2(2022)]|uniref:PIN-like domain-containing protein n=1 Tax=Exiguobacterium sp. B2(2022) TaxID=2992755 RepID=UPI00237ACE69
MTEFKGFIGYEDDEFKNLWSDSIFVVDTNVLINFFKYTSSDSTNSLMKVLRYLKDSNRLWIPHQVALEYFFNYEKNMNKQMDAHSEIHQLKNNLADELKQKISKFRSDHPYISVNTNAKLDEYLSEIEKVGSNLEQTIETEVANMSNPESIHNDILSILKGIVGDPYSQNKIDTIETQGVDRYKYSIPPGFKD